VIIPTSPLVRKGARASPFPPGRAESVGGGRERVTTHSHGEVMAIDSTNSQAVDLSPPYFEIQDHVQGDRHTLILTGELDIAHASQVEAMIKHLCDSEVPGIALDLTGLTFIDSTGIRAIVTAQKLCRERGHEFAIVPGTAAVQRAFEATGLLGTLPFRETPHGGVTRLTAPSSSS
jgi:anti-sigma B factor antagonist